MQDIGEIHDYEVEKIKLELQRDFQNLVLDSKSEYAEASGE